MAFVSILCGTSRGTHPPTNIVIICAVTHSVHWLELVCKSYHWEVWVVVGRLSSVGELGCHSSC